MNAARGLQMGHFVVPIYERTASGWRDKLVHHCAAKIVNQSSPSDGLLDEA